MHRFLSIGLCENSVLKIGEWMCIRSDHVLNVLSVLNIKEKVTPELEGIKQKAHCFFGRNLEGFVTSKSIFSCEFVLMWLKKNSQCSQGKQWNLLECIPFKHISTTDLKEFYFLSGECFDQRIDGHQIFVYVM